MSIVLIGFMGAGKSTAAAGLAGTLGLDALDTDRLIEQRLGKPLERVFAEDGEARFRDEEESVILELLSRDGEWVLSLGGGALTRTGVRHALAGHEVIWLDVDATTAWERVLGSGRPLARDRATFDGLLREREPVYAEVADAVVPAGAADHLQAVVAALNGMPQGAKLLWATTASAEYPAYVGPGLLARKLWPENLAGRRFLVTDGTVGRLYADQLEPLAARIAIMPGEQSKTVAHADIVWTELARAGMTRTDLVVALGGGVVGDLGGFCAATYQRGVRYVQVPTTLVAQVDSAYGGKTGVDLAEAKNYVGAYHHPSAVIADTSTLDTLAPEEIAAGYAEMVKTALIAGGHLWDRLARGENPTAPGLIAACALTKLRIVAQDERDSGARQVLNLGHTVGHAIETVTGYARYRHGEAVGLGLLVALRLSGLSGLREEVREMLVERGLPTSLDGIDPDAVVEATARDKKRAGEAPVPFVLLEGPGQASPGHDVEPSALIAAVRELARA